MQKNTEISSLEEPPGKSKISSPILPLAQLIPNTKENYFFYQNGLSKLIPRLTLQVHSDIETCYLLWDEFSPKKSMFDLWDFRFAWYKGYAYTPYFYTLYERKKPLAVLPLWYSEEKKRFEWFGSNWMEDNVFFVADPTFIDVFFAISPTPFHLNAIEIEDTDSQRKLYKEFQNDDPKNIKEIHCFGSVDSLLSTLHKKSRYHLKSDFHKILAMNPHIEVSEGKDMKSFDELMRLNIQRFNNPTDDSDLSDKRRETTYRHIVNDSGIYTVKFIKVYIQKYLAAVDMVIQYKKRYFTMKGGNNIARFNGIGNFMVYWEFQDAIEHGFSLVDCLQEDYGWKHRYFDQKNVYIWEKGEQNFL